MIHIAFSKEYRSGREAVALIKIRERVRRLHPLPDALADTVQKLQVAVANEQLGDVGEELKTLHEIATVIRFEAFGIRDALNKGIPA